jgi:hypothetical protein
MFCHTKRSRFFLNNSEKCQSTTNISEMGSLCLKVSPMRGTNITFFSPRKNKDQGLVFTDISWPALRS